MGRKTKEVTIAAEGRDKGKTFILTEMSAVQAEAWAARALGAMARAGFDVPEDWTTMGLLTFKLVGMQAFLAAKWEDIEPLLAEVMACVAIKEHAFPDGRELVEADIEEVATRAHLRDEVLQLHLGFSIAADLMGLLAAIREMDASSTTQTSIPSSAPSSPPTRPSQPSTSSKPFTH